MSTAKQITFINENNDFLVSTVGMFCDPVISTLGPGGCTVIIADDNPVPHVTKDGVTVAESIFFGDPRRQAIASLIKEAARKTANTVGDGTTTSIVLAKELILQGLERLSKVTSKKEFFEGFDIAFEKVTDYLEESSIPITKESELLESVVRISTNSDDKICKLIMSAINQVGPDGLVSVDVHDEFTTVVDIRDGASIESTAYIPKGKRWEASKDVALILVAGPIKEIFEIKSLLLKISAFKIPTVIVAKEFSEQVLNTVSVNNQRGSCNVLLVESEGFARNLRMDLLEDLSVIFESPIYSTDGSTSLTLNDVSVYACSNLTRVVASPTETILFKFSDPDNEAIATRYSALKSEYDALTKTEGVVDSGSLRHLQRRLAKYTMAATIKVGAASKAEAVEIRDRIDDALCSISSAVNGGITFGGGQALYKASIACSEMPAGWSEDKISGYNLLLSCCKAPFQVLASNAGVKVSADELIRPGDVYDFRDFEVVHFLVAGIVDPTLVPISALTNSSSVAKTILKSNSIISETWQGIAAELS